MTYDNLIEKIRPQLTTEWKSRHDLDLPGVQAPNIALAMMWMVNSGEAETMHNGSDRLYRKAEEKPIHIY